MVVNSTIYFVLYADIHVTKCILDFCTLDTSGTCFS